jgi:agmatinase
MKILHALPPYNLFGIYDQDYDSAKVVVLPVPYDSTTTYKSGARDGPHAIIEASRGLEFYSEEFGKDLTKEVGIFTLDELEPNLNSPEETVNRIEKEIAILLDDGKFPVVLGGEHTVAVGAIRAVGKKNKEFTVLHFDAHSDYRDSYMGSKYCHACIMARARDVTSSCYSIGVRSIDEESAAKYGKDILYRKDMHGMSVEEIVNKILKRCKEKIYITIDLDVLDPAYLPGTGTPEPDGLSYYELTSILKGIIAKRKVLGMDFNELAPVPGIVAPNVLVAKLIFMALGYNFLKK